MNHYATNTFFDHGGRHYYFAKYLIQKDYDVTIFCASTVHNSNRNIEIIYGKYTKDMVDSIPYVFVKTPSYTGNGKKRIQNMLSFYRNLFPVVKDYAEKHGRPDVILASSVHPLTLVAGIKIARKWKIPCICEIRDLWPETLIYVSKLKKQNPIIFILYRLEKWIYKNADALIFTMEGGKQYIIDKNWNTDIDMSKIYHINNGVDLNIFKYNINNFKIDDKDLKSDKIFKIIYIGSIRAVNNLNLLVKCAEQMKNIFRIKFLIWGDGPDRNSLEDKCKKLDLNNIVFKGKVDKKYVPYIVSKADVNILHYRSLPILQYGGSHNKLFEYLAAGKLIVSDITEGYDILKKYHCGIIVDNQKPEKLKDILLGCYHMDPAKRLTYEKNAQNASKEYDFSHLTDKLEIVIKNLLS